MDELKSVTTWQELKNIIDKEPNTKRKGDIFEALTKYYLLTEPIY